MKITQESTQQGLDVKVAVSSVFQFDLFFNDARTRKARRYKFLSVGMSFNQGELDLKEIEIRKKLSEANIQVLNVFFAETSPKSKWSGVVLHVIVPNLDNK